MMREFADEQLQQMNNLQSEVPSLDDLQNNVPGRQSDVPTIEELMNDPLAKYITFAANDCGYDGNTRDLIVSFVHPLFLKAKAAASAQDNPTWSQAMNGPLADGFWEACKKEIATLEGMDAWEVVKRTAEMKVLKGTWALKIKRYPDSTLRKLKARFCARGDMQVEGVD